MRKAIFIVFCLVILFGIAGAIFNRHMSKIYGPGYTPEHNMDALLAIAGSSRPVREALERFRSDQGRYPATVTNLFPSYLLTTNTPDLPNLKDWAGWDYIPESSNSYRLYYQLEWDGGLWFDHSAGSNQWSWSTSDRVVDLTQKIENK